MIDRRTFLKGLVATAAGVLVPGAVAAEPERRIWALDRTMQRPRLAPGVYPLKYVHVFTFDNDPHVDWTFGTMDGSVYQLTDISNGEITVNNTLSFEDLPDIWSRTYGGQQITLTVRE